MRTAFSRVRVGDAVDLRGVAVDASTVVEAVRNPTDDRVRCPTPGPVHRRAGYVRRGMHLDLVAALAAAARSRGARTDLDATLAETRRRRDRVTVPAVDLASARRAVATAGTEVTALRERVARLSGRVEARREAGDATDAERAFTDATARLSEVETEWLAARQRLDRARERARAARDARETRRRLADRADNLAREARERLASAWYGRFARAARDLPGSADPGDDPDAYTGAPATAALAVARLADLGAPVVVEGDWFDHPADASARLRAPVVLA